MNGTVIAQPKYNEQHNRLIDENFRHKSNTLAEQNCLRHFGRADKIRLQHNDLAVYDTSTDFTIEISFITSAFSPK